MSYEKSAFCMEPASTVKPGRDVDREWEALCETIGVALTPPSRASATVSLTLHAQVNKRMLAALGQKKTKAMLKKNLIASLRNALKALDEGEPHG